MSGASVSILSGCLTCIYAFSAQDRRPPSEEDVYEKLREWDSLRLVRRWHTSRIDTDSIIYRTKQPFPVLGVTPVLGLHQLGDISLGRDVAFVGSGKGFGKDICTIMGSRHLYTSDIHCRSEGAYIRCCFHTAKTCPILLKVSKNLHSWWIFPDLPLSNSLPPRRPGL